MVFVSTPETSTWVAFAESRVYFKHLFCTIGLEHDFSGLNGILFRYIYWEMHVISAKTKVAEFKPDSFIVPERLNTLVDMRLFFETVVVAFRFKHHGHPIVSCVNRWLFMATANYINHSVFFSCRTVKEQANACCVRQKSNCLIGEKRRCDFSSAGLTLLLQTARYSQSQLINSNPFSALMHKIIRNQIERIDTILIKKQ